MLDRTGMLKQGDMCSGIAYVLINKKVEEEEEATECTHGAYTMI